MKFTSYLYIFALTVLCSPRFLIKDRSHNYILYSIIFTLVLYITFDFVNKYTENYEQYNVDVKGVDSLVDLIKTQGGTNEKKIDINNQLFQEAGADDANCWNALGKNQRELEIIKVQLDSYAGSKESIDKLNNQLDSQKEEINKLQDELKGFEGTVTEIDLINIQIKKYQGEIDKLQQQLVLYNQTSETIGGVNNQIAKIQSTITDLNTRISQCNTLNGGKEQNISDLTEHISGHGSTITSLETRKTELTGFITSQNEKITSLEKIINDKTGCITWYYNPSQMSQGNHQKTAENYGGNLASFTSKDQIRNVLQKFDNRHSCWIGGTRIHNNWFMSRVSNSTGWKWFDGTPWSYTNWHSNEPNNYRETSLQLLSDGTWNDARHHYRLSGLYKLPTLTNTPSGWTKLGQH